MIVKFAYFLKTSPRYKKTKLFFYNLLENPNSQYNSYVAFFIISMVLLSVFFLIHEIDHQITELSKILEQGILVVFTIEYLLRFWLASDCHEIILAQYEKAQYLNVPFPIWRTFGEVIRVKIRYMATPMAIIDLLAILPSYETFRFLRIFMVFRLLKLFRHFHSIKVFVNILSNKRFELYTLGIFLGFLIFIGSIVIYLFESHAEGGQIKNLFDGFYWTIVTLSTVGYGDIAPHSTGGRLVSIVLIFSGIGVLSFFTSIMVSGFSEEIYHLRENRTYTEIKRYDDFVILCGFGRVGQHIAKQLAKDKLKFVIIDSLDTNIDKAHELNYTAIHADASKNGVLKSAGINNGASSVLCTTDDDVINVYITLTARNLNPNIHIISRSNNIDNVKKLYQAGASNVIRPFEIAGMVVAEYVGQPVAFEAILGIIHADSDIVMETIKVHLGSNLECVEISSIDFLRRKLILLGVISANPEHRIHKNSYAIKNQHFYFNPPEHFMLRANDLLVVLGRTMSIEHFRSQIEKSRTIKKK
ncbi:MAG: NAD-binding protein [Methylococcales bacterium]|nr:NAD-binding protein [Methylococcales bacterium]MDD5753720.1 NAD-binding protein [Methylococcales bacterium]